MQSKEDACSQKGRKGRRALLQIEIPATEAERYKYRMFLDLDY